VFYIGSWVGCWVAVGVYLFATWWKTPAGQNAMAFVAVLGLVLTVGMIRRVALWTTGSAAWFDAHREPLTFWCFAAVCGVIWWRVALLIHYRRVAVRERRETRSNRPEEALPNG